METLSSDSRAFLHTALQDPDMSNRGRVGIPDSYMGASTVRQTVATSVVVAPPGVTGQTWDCHAVMWPVLGRSTALECTVRNGNGIAANFYTPPAPVTAINIGGVTVFSTNAGQNVFPTAASSGTDGSALNILNSNSLNPDDSFLTGMLRVVGCRLKATYVGPPITASGSCVQWTKPSEPTKQEYVVTNNGNHSPGDIVLDQWLAEKYSTPPANFDDAVRMVDSATRPAIQGGFQVARMNLADCKPHHPSEFGHTWEFPDDNQPLIDRKAFYLGFVRNPVTGNEILRTSTPVYDMPIDMNGMIFEGLALDASIRFEFHITVEQFPDPSNTLLLSYAQPSPKYDPRALELYANALVSMSFGNAAADNSTGDYFRKAWHAIKKGTRIATAVAPLVAPEYAAGAAAANAALEVGRAAGSGRGKKNKRGMTPASAVYVPPNAGPKRA